MDSSVPTSTATSTTASTTSPRPSSRSRPEDASTPNPEDPTFLTPLFLSAKHALTTTTLCARAHTLVDDARTHLQEASVISARCIFLRNALQQQVAIAESVERGVRETRQGYSSEFNRTLEELDAADSGLNRTLAGLRDQAVDAAFDPPAQPGADQRPPRSLYDFVQEDGIEELRDRLRQAIDDVASSDEQLVRVLESFSATLGELAGALRALPAPDDPPDLAVLEEHSDIMGSLLESLTNHYDACRFALETCSGGGTIPRETVEVLQRDAEQVDEVVAELRERLEEIEACFNRVVGHADGLRALQTRAMAVFERFDAFTTTQMQPLVAALEGFRVRQEELREDMQLRLSELLQLDAFYATFISAYDAMVLEVGRRQGLKKRRMMVVEEAKRKLEELWEEDVREREEFKREFGDYLPVDLWAGLGEGPEKVKIEVEGDGGVVEVGRSAIERAMRRRGAGVGPGRAGI